MGRERARVFEKVNIQPEKAVEDELPVCPLYAQILAAARLCGKNWYLTEDSCEYCGIVRVGYVQDESPNIFVSDRHVTVKTSCADVRKFLEMQISLVKEGVNIGGMALGLWKHCYQEENKVPEGTVVSEDDLMRYAQEKLGALKVNCAQRPRVRLGETEDFD